MITIQAFCLKEYIHVNVSFPVRTIIKFDICTHACPSSRQIVLKHVRVLALKLMTSYSLLLIVVDIRCKIQVQHYVEKRSRSFFFRGGMRFHPTIALCLLVIVPKPRFASKISLPHYHWRWDSQKSKAQTTFS